METSLSRICVPEFWTTQTLIVFLESIVVNTVNQALTDTNILSQIELHDIPSYPSDQTYDNFQRRLLVDSHTIANQFQRHSATHSATCFKYGKKSDSVCLEIKFQSLMPIILEWYTLIGTTLCRKNKKWDYICEGCSLNLVQRHSDSRLTRQTYDPTSDKAGQCCTP